MTRANGIASSVGGTPTRARLWIIIGVAVAAVAVRAVIWVAFEQAHFDSDQAIVGLMAKHLAEGRSFPLFFYGQQYMLGVEAWLAAPLFSIAGASVAALKLPLVAINFAVIVLLLITLYRDGGLRPSEALVCSGFFALPPPITASRLVEAQGGNVEPFLYVLLLWMVRDRPLAFGVLAGFAFLNREFSAYAIAAIVIIDLLRGRLVGRESWRRYGVAVTGFSGILIAQTLLGRYADLEGPHATRALDRAILSSELLFWQSLFCFHPDSIRSNLSWLFLNNLPVVFGTKVQRFGDYVNSGLSGGAAWIAVPLTAAIALASVEAVRRRASRHVPSDFGLFLVLTGCIAAAAYSCGCFVQNPMLMRYTLLTLYVPVGILAIFFASRPSRGTRAVVVLAVAVWLAMSGVDNLRVIAEYLQRPRPNPYRELVTYLEGEGVKYGTAPYWTAYQVDFLSRERLTIASREKVRVQEYQDVVKANEARAVAIFFDEPCTGPGEVAVKKWCFMYLDAARHAR